ncbi:MAG: major capsid protein [Firmicutes bacterium]|nr:major capsid protein [[Eubacterium] siraeum]MCM1486793.1 major capsid protein [Bacillota bacterium]
MPTNTLDLFSTYTMMAIVEQVAPESFFFKERYFPTAAGDIFKSDKVLVEYRKGSRKMAAFVTPRLGTIPVERRGYEIHEFEPAYVGNSRALTGDELNKRGFGEALYSNSTPAERAVRLQLEDYSDLDARITRREEWMAVQTMMNNACPIQEYNENGVKGDLLHVQFFDGDNSEHKYTTANKWNSDKANIIGDVKAMCDILAQRGLNAADLIIGTDVADVFYNDQTILKLLDANIKVNFGNIDERIAYPGVSALGVLNFRGYMLTIWVVNNTYEDDDGSSVSYFPADAAMVTFPGCGHLMYGQITQIPHNSDDFQTFTGKRIPKLKIDRDNDTRSLCLASRPLAAPKTYCPYIFAENVIG